MATPTQKNAVQAAADLTAEQARLNGLQCGLNKGLAAVVVLEAALGIAWVQAARFQNANITPERLQEAVRLSQSRVKEAIEIQWAAALRTGE